LVGRESGVSGEQIISFFEAEKVSQARNQEKQAASLAYIYILKMEAIC
jgi:hypothetical protein